MRIERHTRVNDRARRIALAGAAVLALLFASGCERVAQHPAVPPQAKHLVLESGRVMQDLRGDVEQFVSGFGFRGGESAAIGQLTGAMFGVFRIHDAGDVVRAAVEIKRAQACLASVGIESSRIMEDLKTFMFRDEKGKQWWESFETYMDSLELPDLSGAVCDHAGHNGSA